MMDVMEEAREWSASDLSVLHGRNLYWELLWGEAQRLGPDPAFAELDNDEVEQELCSQAVSLAAATCRFLDYLAEFVIRGMWADQGAKTPAAWLSWRLGIAPATARDQVRVALRLRELPLIHERFAAGRLSYSKVRALTRIAVPEFEPMLLKWADAATAAELEQIARQFRWAQKGHFDDEASRRQRRGIRQRRNGDGTVSITIRCDEDEAAELLARLERRVQVGREYDWQATAPVRAEAAAAEEADSAEALGGPGDPGDSAEAPDDLADSDAWDLDGDSAVAPDDPVWDADGQGDSAEARADADVAGDSAEAAEGEEEDGPCLFVPADSPELVDELLDLVASADPEAVTDTSGLDRHTLVLHAPLDALTDEEDRGPVPVQDHHGRIAAMDRRVLRRLACEAGIVVGVVDGKGNPLDMGRRDRRLSVALRRALLLRDRSCRFPGCGVTRHLHAHHIHHWAKGGPTDLDNLVLLCSGHHKYVHDHDVWIRLRPDGRHRFQRPNGREVPRVDRHAIHLQSPADPVPPRHDGEAIDIDALTPPDWWPGQADYNMAVGVLQQQLAALDPPVLAA